MPWGLTRFHHSGQSHYVTFCCYHRGGLLTTDESRRIFESALERVRRSFRLQVYGYVVMPEHVHLLLSEPQRDTSTCRTAPLKPKSGLSGPPVHKHTRLTPRRCGPPVQQIRHVQFGHGRILRFLDHEDPSLRLDHNPAPSRLSCLPANRARKRHLYLASLRLKKLMRSTQRPTKGAIMRSDRIHQAAGKEKGYLALNEVNDDS